MTNQHYLRLYEGEDTDGNLIAEFTGNQIPANVSSCRNKMHVSFSANFWRGIGTDYYAKIHVTDPVNYVQPGESGYCTLSCPCGANEGHCSSDDQCLSGHYCIPDSCHSNLGFANGTGCCQDFRCGYLDMENGILLSPDYPNAYPTNLQCSQLISVEPGKQITMQFDILDVSTFFNHSYHEMYDHVRL